MGIATELVIHHAVVSMQLDPTHQHATKGVISGVLVTDELTAEMTRLAGNIDVSLCTGNLHDSIVTQIEQASDILQDGTQDPAKTCDGISLGLGFDGEIVQLGSIGPATPPNPNPCSDAGP